MNETLVSDIEMLFALLIGVSVFLAIALMIVKFLAYKKTINLKLAKMEEEVAREKAAKGKLDDALNRIEVLEKIVTDSGYTLDKKISSL